MTVLQSYGNPQRAHSFNSTPAGSISGMSQSDWQISIPIIASAAIAVVTHTSALGGGTDGYPGEIIVFRPAAGTGHAASVQGTAYASSFSTLLKAQLSDPLFGGLRINDAFIDNANSRLTIRFYNPTVGFLSHACRIVGIALP